MTDSVCDTSKWWACQTNYTTGIIHASQPEYRSVEEMCSDIHTHTRANGWPNCPQVDNKNLILSKSRSILQIILSFLWVNNTCVSKSRYSFTHDWTITIPLGWQIRWWSIRDVLLWIFVSIVQHWCSGQGGGPTEWKRGRMYSHISRGIIPWHESVLQFTRFQLQALLLLL